MNHLFIWLSLILVAGCMDIPDREQDESFAADDGSDATPGDDLTPDAPEPEAPVDDPTDDDPAPTDDDPPSRPVDPSDDDPEPIDAPEPPPDDHLSAAGGPCGCDSDCLSDAGFQPLCVHGICGARASDDACPGGSSAACPRGHRCWSGTGQGVCYPDFVPGQCAGREDGDGSCVTDGSSDCYRACGLLCDLAGEPPGGGGDDPGGWDEGGDEGDGDDALGPCSGTPAECEAARVINEYRASHVHAGECNNRLRWSDHLGGLAHDHQSGPFVGHSSNGYIENVGMSYDGVRGTAEYIVEYEAWSEPHCAADGSYVMSHHCAAMFCGNQTIGVGVYQQGEATYMTMIFGDASGNPSW
jgi:hypothetical protein